MHLFVPRTVAAVTYRVLIFFAAVTAAVALPAAEPQSLGHDLGEDRPLAGACTSG